MEFFAPLSTPAPLAPLGCGAGPAPKERAYRKPYFCLFSYAGFHSKSGAPENTGGVAKGCDDNFWFEVETM